jgi:phosphate-selective porin OprO/OprP
MNPSSLRNSASAIVVAGLVLGTPISAHAADAALLDVLLENGVITADQHALLMEKEALTSDDILLAEPANGTTEHIDADMAADSDEFIQAVVAEKVATKIEEDFPVKSSHGSSGFRLETRDGNWQTNLQWRAQLRYTNPYFGDPRQVDDFEDSGTSNFEARRLRIKIGGPGFETRGQN